MDILPVLLLLWGFSFEMKIMFRIIFLFSCGKTVAKDAKKEEHKTGKEKGSTPQTAVPVASAMECVALELFIHRKSTGKCHFVTQDQSQLRRSSYSRYRSASIYSYGFALIPSFWRVQRGNEDLRPAVHIISNGAGFFLARYSEAERPDGA